jgi:hypothetical protein
MADIAPADFGVEIVDLADEAQAVAPAPVLADDGAEPLPAGAELQADGSVILRLRHPVTIKYRQPGAQAVQEDVFEDMHFHRLTGADMRAMAQAAADDRIVLLIAKSSRTRPQLMHLLYDRMDAADVTAASLVVGFFLGSGRKTGR